jgi:hypothetical protein
LVRIDFKIGGKAKKPKRVKTAKKRINPIRTFFGRPVTHLRQFIFGSFPYFNFIIIQRPSSLETGFEVRRHPPRGALLFKYLLQRSVTAPLVSGPAPPPNT